MARDKVLVAVRARILAWAARGTLEPGLERVALKALRKLERALHSKNARAVKTAISDLARVLLRFDVYGSPRKPK